MPLTRQQLVSGLFKGTYKKLRDTPLGTYPGSALAWLAENRPDILAAAEAAEAAVDATALDFLAERTDEAAFRAAGKAWYAAWVACGLALPPTPPSDTEAPPVPPPTPPSPSFVPLRPLAPGQVRDFKELGVAVRFVGEAKAVEPKAQRQMLDFWLVSEYTGQDRTELSVADLDRIAAITDTFPGSAVAALRRPAPTVKP